MKKIKLLVATLAVVGFSVSAKSVPLKDVEYYTQNPSVYSQECIEAVEHGKTFRQLKMKYPKYRLEQRVKCNGQSLEDFVNEQYEYRKLVSEHGEDQYDVVAADSSFASELCEASAKSNRAFKAALKSRGLTFDRVSHLECNGVPVIEFAKSSGNPKFSI